jgi:hypothetical protein
MGKGQPQATDHQKLRGDLQKLHAELQASKSVDQGEQRMLQILESDIQELLSRDDLKPDQDSRERLTEAMARLEASHPRATLLIRQVVDSLAYLGV